MSKVGVEAMIVEIRVHRVINNWGRIGMVTKERGAVRQRGTLASKLLRIIVLLIQLVQSVERITRGNVVKELPYVISTLKKGIMPRGAQLKY